MQLFRAQFKPTDGILATHLAQAPNAPAFIIESLRALARVWKGVAEGKNTTIRVELDPEVDRKVVEMLASARSTRDVSRLIRAACFFHLGERERLDPSQLAEEIGRLGIHVSSAPPTIDEGEFDKWVDGV